jgi:predicted nucleic acid-binding protein
MIAFDTNLLIYAHRAGAREHRRARRAIERALASGTGCGISIPSLPEFWSIVTHPAAAGGPSRPELAAAFVDALVTAGVQLWGPGPDFAQRLLRQAIDLRVSGVRIFDLQIGLIAFDNGAHTIWTHDRAFIHIPGLLVHDPL